MQTRQTEHSVDMLDADVTNKIIIIFIWHLKNAISAYKLIKNKKKNLILTKKFKNKTKKTFSILNINL